MAGQLAARPPNAPPASPLGLGIQPGTNRIVIANYVIVFGTGAGVFIYDGTPAAGNPPVLAAVSPNTSQDPYGNTIPAVAGSPAVLDVGDLAAGGALIGIDAAGNLVAHAADGSGIRLLPGTPEMDLLDTAGVLLASADPVNGFRIQTGPAATDLFAAFRQDTATGSAGVFFGLNQDAPAGTGHVIFHPQGGIFTEAVTTFDPVAGYPVVETWHPLTLAAGWSNVAGYVPAAYRLNAMGNVELAGRITGTISGTTTIATLPAHYYSATYARAYGVNVDSATAGLVAAETPHLHCTTAGVLAVTGINNGTATVDLDGTFMLSAG